MCGIFGVVGSDHPTDDVLTGLERLEYRGYDSAGIATIHNGNIDVTRRVGKLLNLKQAFIENPFTAGSSLAIGHTRWATHGEPTTENAHPHMSEKCAVVHNGIIENYQEIKDKLIAKGHIFKSETDTEVLPILISENLKNGMNELDAVIKTLNQVEGAFALGVVFNKTPNTLFAARRGSPLLAGRGNGTNYIASDAIALAPFTNKITYLDNDDIAVISTDEIKIYRPDGKTIIRQENIVDVSASITGKDGYRHFMLKEIHEQPHAISKTLEAYLSDNHQDIILPNMPFNLADIAQINLIACGTSSYAAMVARYWFEELADTPVNVDVASEFRYRKPPFIKNSLSIFISQSGETADTLAGLELAKEQNQHTLGLVNVPTSTIAREASGVLTTFAGPEIGVASTKAFTTQLVVLALFAIKLAEAKGKLDDKTRHSLLQALIQTPQRMMQILDKENEILEMAEAIAPATSALYLGRNSLFPIAQEGALKLKEISYIHAEGAAAGEMKHGLIALVDEKMPIIALATGGALLEKTLSNIHEVQARKGRVYLLSDKTAADTAGEMSGGKFITPDAHPFVAPILMALPVQLLAYHVAVIKGTDVDQPRNLAKSVTVE